MLENRETVAVAEIELDGKHNPPRATSRTNSRKSTKGATARGKKHKPAQTSKQKSAFMYVGPNIPGGKLFTGSLFRDSIPKHLDDDFKKLPELEKLFVDVMGLPRIKRDLEEQGTEAYNLYQYVELRISEGVLKNGI